MDNYDEFENFFNELRDLQSDEAELKKFRKFVNDLYKYKQESGHGSIHYQDLFVHFYNIEKVRGWQQVLENEDRYLNNIQVAFNWFIENEYYEEAAAIKKAIQYIEQNVNARSEPFNDNNLHW